MDIGSGDEHPIVFIHGLGGQWQNWLENIPRFAQDRRVIALDLPGFGLSPMPAEQITIEFYGRVRRRPVRPSSSSARAWSSATRWAATSPPSWRSSTPSWSSA